MKILSIEIQAGLPDELRTQAAEIYFAAFSKKIHPLVPDLPKAVALLARLFDANQALIAVQDGRCLGIAGLHYRDHFFVTSTRSIFIDELGWRRGIISALLFHAFEPHPRKNELRIECLAVSPDARGKGIGTQLLAATYATAREKGFTVVRLEVVDTNPNARRLYEREGFVCMQRQHIPLAHYFAGFSAQDLMVKKI